MQGDARDGRIAARPGPNFPSPGTIRRVLLLGFCLVFALWLGSGYDLWRRLDEVQARTAVVNARYSTAEQLVGTIRAQMLLGSLYLRDLLLDIPSTGTAGYHD
jgi:hypothetical protein